MNAHPCETCLRWPECNGVDWGSCPDSAAQTEKEKAPTAMAEFMTGRLPEVHWSRPEPCPITPEQFEAIYNDDEED